MNELIGRVKCIDGCGRTLEIWEREGYYSIDINGQQSKTIHVSRGDLEKLYDAVREYRLVKGIGEVLIELQEDTIAIVEAVRRLNQRVGKDKDTGLPSTLLVIAGANAEQPHAVAKEFYEAMKNDVQNKVFAKRVDERLKILYKLMRENIGDDDSDKA